MKVDMLFQDATKMCLHWKIIVTDPGGGGGGGGGGVLPFFFIRTLGPIIYCLLKKVLGIPSTQKNYLKV